MQETGPSTPTDETQSQVPAGEAHEADYFSDQGASAPAAAAVANGKGKGKSKKAKKPAGPPRTNDPVIRWLTLAIAGVVVFWAVAMISAMFFGLLKSPTSPRTSAERDLMTLTGTVQSGKATAQTYAQYVATLISAGQLSKAQEALDEALKNAKADKSYLYAQQAELALVQKDYQGAVEAADKAMTEAQKELQAFMDENVKNNRKRTAAAVMPESYETAALAKAEALLASKDYKNAIKAFDIYLKKSPTDSDILCQRAQAKIQVGDKEGAEKDFKEALKYIPDYQPALDGLKQIGAAK